MPTSAPLATTRRFDRNTAEITRGSPYWATTLAGVDASRQPSENELAIARFSGQARDADHQRADRRPENNWLSYPLVCQRVRVGTEPGFARTNPQISPMVGATAHPLRGPPRIWRRRQAPPLGAVRHLRDAYLPGDCRLYNPMRLACGFRGYCRLAVIDPAHRLRPCSPLQRVRHRHRPPY